MSLTVATLLTLTFTALLFAFAWLVERRGERIRALRNMRHIAFTLALGVYCSSWTFYGAVGSAVRDGWNYLPIYLAPILLLVAAPRFLQRLADGVAHEGATTVSDFIAARFGNDLVLARLVTITALLGSIPYVALQLRSIGNAMAIVSGHPVAVPAMSVAAALLALFAMLFGARRFELSGRSEGLVYAIGLDSLFKVMALVAVAAFAGAVLFQTEPAQLQASLAQLAPSFRPESLSIQTAVIFLISGCAIIALPRQFYMGLVEAQRPTDLVKARLGLAAYIALMAALVLPIALAGHAVLGPAVTPDLYVLQLPAARGNAAILAFALLGGVGAAASMAIVDSTALATMVSNDLVSASVIRERGEQGAGEIGRRMLLIRRVAIASIMLLALCWALLVSPKDSLASIGLIAFAAIAQFTPHLILAANGGGRDPVAGRTSLAVGLALWSYTLALPPIVPANWLAYLSAGPFDPLQLFGIGSADPLVHGVTWSLGANLAILGMFTARRIGAPRLPRLRGQRRLANLGELVQLTASFVGQDVAEANLQGAGPGAPIDGKSAQRAQELISRVVGAASARALIASALDGGSLSLPQVARLLDASGQNLRFSRQLLAATFENIDAGISVVDSKMNLVAWNSRYLELFDYPPGLVRVGVPVAELIRHNARRGDFGPGDSEFHVAKRLDHMRREGQHSFERRRSDGRVIKTVGGPMPGGGYVMSFTDITEEVRVRDELESTLDQLEARVADRTRELSDAARRLAKADHEKTRFLAAASHDLLQPLHAARLFTAALQREAAPDKQPLIRRVDSAIVAAEDLLRALLDISKLDAGGVKPTFETIELRPFLTDLVESFRPLASEKGLDLRLGPMPGSVCTDPGLLRSVMQNFLTNAIRYTPSGAILVGVRRRDALWRIDVIDSGVGIAPDKLQAIFGEFVRVGEVEVEGLGLGLALVERIARLLGGSVDVASIPGSGSRFSLALPMGDGRQIASPLAMHPIGAAVQRRLSVLVVDNDRRIVEASTALLKAIGHQVRGAENTAGALEWCAWADVVLADYLLNDGENGLSLIEAMRERRPGLPAVLITAESSELITARAARLGVPVLAKPAASSDIEAFLAGVSVLEIKTE